MTLRNKFYKGFFNEKLLIFLLCDSRCFKFIKMIKRYHSLIRNKSFIKNKLNKK